MVLRVLCPVSGAQRLVILPTILKKMSPYCKQIFVISVTNNSNNSYDNLDLVSLNLYSEKLSCVYRPPLNL